MTIPLAALTAGSVPIRTRDLIVVRVLNVTSTVTIQFGGRLLKNDGTQVDINEQKTLAVTGTVVEFTVQVVNGWLLSFQVNAQQATLSPSSLYIEAFISFGSGTSTQRYRSLFAGYLDTRSPLAWPQVYRTVPGDGPGDIRTFTISQPAVNTELLSGNLPEGKYYFRTLHFKLVSDANAANRRVSINIMDDGGAVVAFLTPNVTQVASTTWHYTFSLNANNVLNTAALIAYSTLPDMYMSGDYQINTVTSNMQAGDRYSALSASIDFWAGIPI